MRTILLSLLGLAAACGGNVPKAGETADIVLTNGVFFRADGVAIKGKRILAVRDVEKYVGPRTRVVDLKGKFVCPGFNDAHIHFASGGSSLLRLNLAGIKSLEEVRKKIAEAVKKSRPGEWLLGRGWDHTLWSGEERFPGRKDLDDITGDVPVSLRRIDGHVVWANSKALELSGITRDTAVPAGGEIEKADGEPTGILKESATRLLKTGRPARIGKAGSALGAALEEAMRNGVTSIQTGGESLEEYVRLYDAGKLTVRAYVWGVLGGDVERYARERVKYADHPMFRRGCLKGFADGTLGSGTAAFFEPYIDRPGTGLLQWTPRDLKKAVAAADKAGLQVTIHAIGDKGISVTLDAFDHARKANGPRDSRHRVEHVQVIRPQDIARFRELRVIASMQPCHVTNDLRWAEKRVGRERCEKGGYLWKSFLDQDVRLAFGTDWPVEPMDTMKNLYACITRKTLDGKPDGGWFPKERLTMEQAIDLYTRGSAYAEFAENEKGSLKPGQWADLAIIDTNLLTATPEQVLNAKVVATVFDGKLIHGDWP